MKVKKVNLINILIIPRTVLNSESNHAKILVRNTYSELEWMQVNLCNKISGNSLEKYFHFLLVHRMLHKHHLKLYL